MKLVNVVSTIDSIEDDYIIFQEDIEKFDSNVLLSYAEDGEIKENNRRKYHYLIEVFLAKEFIIDWIQSLNYKLRNDEIAKGCSIML
ncbi:hypothetical protein [Flavobacterium kingsejongi]|uniref:Uncharacterized protein n=1 Tax=Flavobacterium kingsejongi TaxID=1678728 RepID=A0A2S1LL26_9FLAO|nr:hypothetical protein [Flavobacterium kingsejongi]AWG24399.1 hypothetical protein FK004_03705 [Flavobacterium kingsejongi]